MRLISDSSLAVATVWQEARGEPHVGRIAVGEVIRNRMKRRDQTVAEIVLAALQFSGWNARDPNRIPSAMLDDTDPLVKDCAAAWLESETTNLTQGATLYFNPTLAQPSWAAFAVLTVTIGQHRFYRE